MTTAIKSVSRDFERAPYSTTEHSHNKNTCGGGNSVV